jgi:hypothetical protein
MLKMILVTSTLLGFCAAAMAQDTKPPATTGPAAQSGDNMAKGDSKKRTTKSTKMKKTDTK